MSEEEMEEHEARELAMIDKIPFKDVSLEDFMHTLGEDFQGFQDQLELFFSNKYLDWMSVKFIEEDNVLNLYRFVKALAHLFEVSFSEKDASSLRDVERKLKSLNKHYTIDAVLEKHQENSNKYEYETGLIEEVTEQLGDLFHRVNISILNRNKNIAELKLVQESKKAIIEAIKSADGKFNIGGTINDVQDFLGDLNNQEKTYVEYIQNPEFQPSADVFKFNREKKERKEVHP